MTNIKGITIELNGDTTGLTQALKKVDGETKKVQAELKQVDNLLKFDPTNIELLSQKQQLLGDAINSTSTRLDALKQAQSQVEEQFKNGEIGEAAYRKFQREIIATEGKLKSFKAQADAVDVKIDAQADTTAIDKMKDKLGEVADVAKEVGGKIGDGLKTGVKVGAAAIAGIGTAAAGAAVGVGAFVESQKEMNMDLARLRTNAETAGFSLDSIETGFQKIAAVSGEADSAVEAMSNLMATDFSEAQLAEAIEYVNGAAIKFSDTLKTEGIADGLQETFATGKAIGPFAELLERSGVDLEKFDAGLAKAAKTGTETDYVLQQLSQLGLSSTYQAYQDNNAALLEYNQAQADSELKLAALATALTPFVTAMLELGNIILDVVLGNKSLAEGFSELVEILQGLSEKFLSAAKDSMPSFIKGIQDALPQVLEAGVKILTKIVEGIASKYPTLLSTGLEVINKLGTTLINNLPKLLDAGVKLLTSIISGITSNLPKLVSTALNLVLKLASTIVSNLPKIIEAGVKILTSIVSGIAKALPDLVTYLVNTFIPKLFKTITSADWKQIGTDIINGLIKGIKDMTESAVEAITGVVDSVTNAAKKLLGIKSPSRVFKQIGEWVSEGWAIGIEEKGGMVENAISDIALNAKDIAEHFVDEEKKLRKNANADIAKIEADKTKQIASIEKRMHEDLEKTQRSAAGKKKKNAEDEALKIQRIKENAAAKISKLEETSSSQIEKIKTDSTKKIVGLESEMDKTLLEETKRYIDDKKSLEQLSLADEAFIWEQSIKLFAEGSKERVKAQQEHKKATVAVTNEIASINKQYQDKMQKINDDLIKQEEEHTKKYKSALDARVSSLTSFSGTFDAFVVELKSSGVDLMTNLQSQVDGFKQWQSEFEKLSGRGIDADLLEELSGLGVKALPELMALNQLTDEQLSQYSALYQEKAQLARTQAEAELVGMKTDTQQKIDDLRKVANTELSKLQTEWDGKIKGVTQVTKNELSTLKQIGVDAGQGLLDGLTSMEGPLIDKATEIANAISSAIQSALDIHSPSRVMKGFGVNIGQGLIVGMDNMINKVAQSSNRLSAAAKNAYSSLSGSTLKSSENAQIARNTTTTTTTTHVTEQHFHITISSPKAMDPYEAARLAKLSLKEAGMQL